MSRNKFKNKCRCFHRYYTSLYHFLTKKYYIWWFRYIFFLRGRSGGGRSSRGRSVFLVGAEESFVRGVSRGTEVSWRGAEVSFRKAAEGAEVVGAEVSNPPFPQGFLDNLLTNLLKNVKTFSYKTYISGVL